jgi:predicted phage-related endonuclease
MTFTILDCEQRSPEWFTARAGRVTSSNAADMLATISKGEAAARRNLRARLALERVTGKTLERDFQSQAMKDGVDREADALAEYEVLTGRLVVRTGFLKHNELMAGASLDGALDDFSGIVEAKSPLHATHLEYLRTGRVPLDYMRQLTHQLWLTGAQWCDWFSFQPDFPPALRVKLVRVKREDVDLAAYELALRLFLSEVDAEHAEIAALAKAVA